MTTIPVGSRAMNSARYLVPNGCTATSMLFGLASVMCSAQGAFDLAAWMILWGVLLDKLDGVTARLMKATSEFGADFVVFGIAPGALIYFRSPTWNGFKPNGVRRRCSSPLDSSS